MAEHHQHIDAFLIYIHFLKNAGRASNKRWVYLHWR